MECAEGSGFVTSTLKAVGAEELPWGLWGLTPWSLCKVLVMWERPLLAGFGLLSGFQTASLCFCTRHHHLHASCKG